MKLLPLTRGYAAKVDDDVFTDPRICRHKWCAQWVQNRVSASRVFAPCVYAVRTAAVAERRHPRVVLLHREILELAGVLKPWVESRQRVVFVDGDSLNCQRSNLRVSAPPVKRRTFVDMGAKVFMLVPGVPGVVHNTSTGGYEYEIGSGYYSRDDYATADLALAALEVFRGLSAKEQAALRPRRKRSSRVWPLDVRAASPTPSTSQKLPSSENRKQTTIDEALKELGL